MDNYLTPEIEILEVLSERSRQVPELRVQVFPPVCL